MSEEALGGISPTKTSPNNDEIETANRSTSQVRELSQIFGLRSAGVFYALIVLLAILTTLSALDGRPFFLRPINVSNLLEQTALLGIISIGMALLLISGSFDLSVGSLAALSAIVAAIATNQLGPELGILAGIATGFVGGMVNGTLHWYVGLNPFIVTLGTLSAYRGLALVVSSGRTVIVRDPNHEIYLETYFGGHWMVPNILLVVAALLVLTTIISAHFNRNKLMSTIGYVSAAVIVAISLLVPDDMNISFTAICWLGITALAWIGLNFTVYGRRLRATGANSNAALVSGVKIARYKIVPFIIVGSLAGLSGSLILARLGAVDPNVFTAAELTVIAAAVVGGVSLFGGVGSVIKTAVGAFLLFTINNGLNMLNVSSNYQLLVAGIIIIVSASLYVLSERRARGG